MSYSNFNRGRGFGPPGTRAARRFGRPHFPRPPFRHVGPPRPGHPMRFGMPWQPNNVFFQPHPLRGSPQFRADGRRRRFGNYDIRFPTPNRLPVPQDHEEFASDCLQMETDQDEAMPPLLGSEEERQRKIAETADRLKQKLSSFSSDEITDIWNEDAPPSCPAEDDCIENPRIPVVGYKSSELNLTYNDLKDIGKINPDYTKLDDAQYPTDICNFTNNADSNVTLDENENGSRLAIPSDQMTNLEDVPNDSECAETDSWVFHEPVDNSRNLGQLDVDNNINLLESDLEFQRDIPLAGVSQDQDDQQQDAPREIGVYPANAASMQEESETLNLQAASFPIDSAGQEILQKEDEERSQNEEGPVANLEVQESVLILDAESPNNSGSTLTQLASADVPMNNVTLDNQLPRVMESSFHGGPPRLSPHTEQELPVDFDPSTPPPILLKQEQSRILPPYSIPPELPPLFDPTAPPPNIKCLLGSQEDVNPAWSNAQNPMPAVYSSVEVHAGLNTHGGFILQPPLEMPGQSNVFLPPHVDSVNFPPIFPMPSSSHSGMSTHVPSILPQMHATPHNTFVPPHVLPELPPSSDLSYSVNKDDGLDDMQEAMKFAIEMTASVTGRADEESRSSPKSLSANNILIDRVSDVEFISLPPERPRAKINKVKRMRKTVTRSKKEMVPEERSTADYLSPEEILQDANVRSKDALLIKEQDRPKVVFNLNNKTKVVSTKKVLQENSEKKNGMTQSVESEKTRATPSVTRKNLETALRRNKEEKKSLKRNENNSECTLFELITSKNATLPHRTPQKDVNMEKCSNVSPSKVAVQKELRSPVETSENSTTEALWKNKIISRFLKMSKNDIYNMVNDTSLRKFDIIMKRLVKEKKPTLSLKMRHVQDEKMKSYDQQEFMKQLNAMLDTDAVVSITDLPTEFIHHLNEVLQLDVQPDNHTEPAAASSSQCGQSESTNYAFSPVIDNVTECANKTARSNNVRRKNVKNKGRTTKTPYNKSVEAHDSIKNNNLNTKDDTCNTIVASEICNTVIANDICNSIVANDSSISSNLLTLQHDLDDIFSKVTKKNQIPAAAKERKRCDMSYVAISRSMEEALLEDEMHNLESSPRWDEKCDRWKRKEREDPHAYRNLTKEEWEERYGTQPSSTPFSADNIAADNNEPLPRRGRGRKLYLRRRYSSESSKHPPNTRHRSLEKDKHKKSRRHSDDRRHSTGYLEYNASHDSNSSSSSTSSSSSNSSSTNSSDNANVTKLLRVIKENEKVAKQVSLNEAIRDEVNAEIERDRRSRKLRKHSKNRKQRKTRHKKKRKQDKETSSSNSSSEKDDNDEATDRLLTESEIKKEVVENQITQEVIIKEEVDIGQEENVDAEFANATSLVVENRAAYLLSAPQNIPESPFEIPPATANATQLHTEDRLPTASPTHPKTKAQLKQMPETSDMNDNKVSLNVFTCVPEDWNTFNPANLSKSAEDLSRSCETADNGCDQDSSVLSTIDNCTSQNGNAVSCGKADKDASPQQQQDTTARTFTESSPKVQDDNEIVATDNNVSRVLRQDNVSTVSTPASSASDISPPSTVTQKQGASKKIDIKTYYERTIQRRMNEKLEMKKPVENPAISTPKKPSTSKVTGPEIAVKKPTYSGSIQDPRLLSAKVAIAPINSKVDISQTTSRKNVRQKEAQVTKESTNAEPAPRCPEGKNSNPTIDSNSVVKQINEDKTKDKVPPAANNIKILSNVVVTPKIAVPKFKKCSEVKKRTDKNSQSKVSSDETKRFKNIRSEGGKELKLKKETAGEQKAKKKSAVTSKSVSFVSTNVYIPVEEAVQEKKIDNNCNTSKMENKRLVDSRETKINNSNTKTELSTISSENADNNGNELSHETVKAKRSSNCDIERENAKKTVSNIEGADAHEHSSKMRSKVTRNAKRAKNVAGVEIADKKGQIARETCSAVPELNVSTSKVAAEVPENKVSSDIEKIRKKSSSASKVQPINAARSTGFSSSYAGQSKIKKSKSAINRETSSNSELDGLDGPSKEENQLLINSNIKTSDIKDNNTVLNAVGVLKSASANEDESVAKKTAESSSASKENSQQGATSSDSVGSPFKGFLQETMIDFEQPNLFNIKLEVDANKKNTIFLDDCNVNYAMRAASCKDTTIEGQQDYEALESSTNYANDADVNASENFNIAFGNALLASDKECTTTKKGDEPGDLAMINESREEDVKRSPSETLHAATTLHDEDNDINIGGSNETEGQLMSKEGYASCAGLVMKESMFINEEEVIQGEARSKDLASKLKTTTDPSLSDALETTISDDALRLPESQGAEHLDNHMYLETNISAEKAACDKLPGFDADEHLDSDIFYLDDRLRSTTAFDNKDEESVHFPVHQQSLRYDITLAVTPETTMITPCADLSKPEVCKFDLKHVSSTDNDLLAGGASAERSSGDTPRTLNIPTKAALKEAATNLFLKYPSNVSTATKEMALEVLDKQGETDLSYHTPAWHVNRQNNIKTHPQETRNNTRAQGFINVNTISSTQSSTYDEPAHNNMDVDHGNMVSVKPRGDMEKFFHGGLQRNPVVELRKMKELDRLLEQRRQGNSEKVKKSICEGKKKHNGTILRKIKDKRQIKCRGKETSNRISLVKRLKKMRQSGKLVSTTREAILARMLEIDLEMHKLATEKLKLHEILQNIPSTENSAANSGVISRTREDESVVQPEVPEIPSTLMAQEASETSCAKRANVLPSRPSARQRKRISSRNSENEETSCTPVYQKTKMPVIKWKKKPRLEQIVRREEEEEDDEEKDLAETTEQQISTSAGKEAKDGSSEDASEDNVQRPEPNAVVDDEAREEQTTEKPDKEAVCDVIDSGRTISSDKSTADKIADDRSEWHGFADDETERTKYPDIDKRDNVLPPSEEAARTSCRQVHSTPEPSSIYSDDSTWNSITQNTASEVHEIRTGLVLLEQTLKKQLVKSRKMRAIVRKKKKRQLDTFLRTVNKLTMEEEELPLSKLYITKLQQKRDLLDALSRKKEDADLVVDPDMKNLDKVINAVAENRVEDLYEPPLEARASDEVPATSNNASSVLQSDKDQFYVDAEANANSDWPCREKENVEEVALQQNDVPDADGSNHVFKAVSQDKVPFYNDRNVEPDSSITPEETLTENHSSDCERLKDSNNIASRNIDIKVSVPKILIKDDFSLGLLQKLQDTEAGVAGAGLVDSTTNILSASSEKEGDKSSRDTSQAVETLAKESNKDEKGEMKEKHAVNASEKEETVDSVSNAPSVPQSNVAKSGYSDATENEESGDSAASNRCDKVATTDTGRDLSVSYSAVEKSNTKQKELDAEPEQLSNDATALKQDCQSLENAVAEEEKSNPENKSHAFERILDNDQSTSNSVPVDLVNEGSEESNEASVEPKSSLERTFTTFSFNKAAAKGAETSKKLRRKQDSSTPTRRSTRKSNENIKSIRIKEADANSNSSERDSTILHERNIATRSRSKSPTWAMRDESVTSNGRKSRVARKVQNVISRKVGAKSKTKTKEPVKHFDMITESAFSNNSTVAIAKKRKQHTEWQMKNCKVQVVDCKSVLLKYVNSEVLDRLGIIAIDDSSCVHHTTSNQNIVTPTTASGDSFFLSDRPCYKENLEIEILDEKPVMESNDKALTRESVLQVAEIDEEESTKLEYTIHKGPILDIKVFENSFLAASEDHKIYRYSQVSSEILNIYEGHKSAVTCLYVCKSDIVGVNKELMYSGSLDGTLRCYNITTGELVKNPAQVNSAIQCMDQAWGIIFIGTKSGHVSRFHITAGAIKGNSIPFSDKSVLALKATNEGPRRILIVASRNQPITIRDAQTGLFLRTISGQKNHITVYSLLRHNNLIYCGTSSRSINVFDFTTGEQVIQYDAGVGIVCMRLYKQLLFAGCYDGNIYVFDINNHKLVCSIQGPGNMLLSVEVVNNKIIAGSKDKRLHSWQMPTQVRALL